MHLKKAEEKTQMKNNNEKAILCWWLLWCLFNKCGCYLLHLLCVLLYLLSLNIIFMWKYPITITTIIEPLSEKRVLYWMKCSDVTSNVFHNFGIRKTTNVCKWVLLSIWFHFLNSNEWKSEDFAGTLHQVKVFDFYNHIHYIKLQETNYIYI